MGRLNDVTDELWDVARAALLNSVHEAIEDVEHDLNPEDHHGQFVLRSVARRLREGFEASARSVDPQ